MTQYTNYPTRLLYLPRGAERLAALGQLRRYPRGAVIIRQDVVPTYCYVVLSGRIIAYEYNERGDERIYNFLEKNAMFLEANLILNTPAPVAFRTGEPSDLACIDRETLVRAIGVDPDVAYDVVQSLSIKFLSSMDQVRESGGHSAAWKIVNLLLIFADQYGTPYDGKVLIKHPLSQQMISNLLGINRVTTTHAIKTLKDMGLVEHINGYYCIRDVDRLKRHLDYCG